MRRHTRADRSAEGEGESVPVANGISNGCGLLLLHGIKKAIFMPPVHLKSSPSIPNPQRAPPRRPHASIDPHRSSVCTSRIHKERESRAVPASIIPQKMQQLMEMTARFLSESPGQSIINQKRADAPHLSGLKSFSAFRKQPALQIDPRTHIMTRNHQMTFYTHSDFRNEAHLRVSRVSAALIALFQMFSV